MGGRGLAIFLLSFFGTQDGTIVCPCFFPCFLLKIDQITPCLLPSVTPSGVANYTTSHNQVELVLQPQVVKTGEVRVSGCGFVHEASECVCNSSLSVLFTECHCGN